MMRLVTRLLNGMAHTIARRISKAIGCIRMMLLTLLNLVKQGILFRRLIGNMFETLFIWVD